MLQCLVQYNTDNMYLLNTQDFVIFIYDTPDRQIFLILYLLARRLKDYTISLQ
jgi:hypothetical protein